MQLKIKKQTEETITIETPKYYRTYYTNTIVKITDDGMIKVGKDILVFFQLKLDYVKIIYLNVNY